MNEEQNAMRAHYNKECKKWLKTLNELRLENIRLKEQLSKAINQDVTPRFIEQAEQCQQLFLEKDQIIDLLRHDIKIMLDKLSEHTITRNEEYQYVVLKKDISKLIHEFQLVTVSFYKFLAENNSYT